MKEDILGYIMILFIIIIVYKIYNESDIFQLTCVMSTVDGEKYCVRERKNIQNASDLLAKTTKKMKELVEHLKNTQQDKESVKRLIKRFNPNKIVETLPTSEYTAYSENKGQKLAFCLNKENENNNNLIDENTLMFVALHEMSHIASKSIGHNDEFWNNFKFLIIEAKNAGLYNPVDYKKTNTSYCGMEITDNPYYDM